jgi:hypothetical protein
MNDDLSTKDNLTRFSEALAADEAARAKAETKTAAAEQRRREAVGILKSTLKLLVLFGLPIGAASYYKAAPEIWVFGAIALYAVWRIEEMRESDGPTAQQKDPYRASAYRTLPAPPRHELRNPQPMTARTTWRSIGISSALHMR